MSDPVPGRHRAATRAPRRRPMAVAVTVVVVVVVVVVVAALIGVAAWWVSNRSSGDTPRTGPGSSTPGTSTATGSPDGSSHTSSASSSPSSSSPSSSPAAVVETDRTVTLKGQVVTVVETSSVVDGTAAQAAPTDQAPVGLRLIDSSIVTADGRTSPFAQPVRLAASGTLTVQARYDVLDCPDLLPATWPVPVAFPDSTRSYTRIDEPLHTASAVCPGRPSTATPLEQMSAALVPGSVPVVKLAWGGSDRLTIAAVGAASGVAAVPVEAACEGACVAEIEPGGTTTLTLQPVDPCPPATRDDTLTLQLESGDVVRVTVDGLHEAVCG